ARPSRIVAPTGTPSVSVTATDEDVEFWVAVPTVPRWAIRSGDRDVEVAGVDRVAAGRRERLRRGERAAASESAGAAGVPAADVRDRRPGWHLEHQLPRVGLGAAGRRVPRHRRPRVRPPGHLV